VRLGHQMSTYWSNFAWTSNPNNRTGRLHPMRLAQWLPEWKGYTHESDMAVMLDVNGRRYDEGAGSIDGVKSMRHPRADNCEIFWDEWFQNHSHWHPPPFH